MKTSLLSPTILLSAATDFQPVQIANGPNIRTGFLGNTGNITGQEDCLFLNVYRPSIAQSGRSKVPIMFWIHDGGYVNGDGLLNNSTALAATHDVIVVTLNYRLGHLGFFGSQRSLSEEGTTGNWGALDTQLGLKWVQENIEAFGGDKNRVLLFGQSAGAFTVMWHLAAPGSKGLFHSAIMQSGTTSTPMLFQNSTDAFRYYDWGFAIPDGIRFDPGRAPTWASPFFPNLPVGPIIDGTTLPDNPLRVVENGNHNDVPLVIGFTRDEGSFFGFLLPGLVPSVELTLGEQGFQRTVNHFLQNDTASQEVETFYPPKAYASVYGPDNGPFQRAAYFIRDSFFHCSGRRLAEALRKTGKSPTWMYSFDKPDLFGSLAIFNLGTLSPTFGNLTVGQLGTYHSADLAFVFKEFGEDPANFSQPGLSLLSADTFMAHPPRERGDTFHHVSDAISCMWAHMAAHGTPTGLRQYCPGLPNGSIPPWLPYNSSLNGSGAQGAYMHIGDVLSMQSWRLNNLYPDNEMPSIELCQWWDEHPFGFHDLRADIQTTTTTTPASSAQRQVCHRAVELVMISFVIFSCLS
ncbi:hypothetical protein FOZ60_002257 [Perkinsus olseni]|uniref:Carboxylic ester hydrolase n=1 Tax=Perkinsus olseni TaxID=32597 RepID=A0A7J6NYA3_PEROL|nr:hypothetical protein FOZ60_002257 [Perkinsus olseni]